MAVSGLSHVILLIMDYLVDKMFTLKQTDRQSNELMHGCHNIVKEQAVMWLPITPLHVCPCPCRIKGDNALPKLAGKVAIRY